MWIPHRVFFGNLAIVSAVALGLILLVWVARRAPEIALAIGGSSALAGAFLGLTATRGMPLSWPERGGIALRTTAMLSCWLLATAGAILVFRRRGAPTLIQALVGTFTLGVAYLATRAMLR